MFNYWITWHHLYIYSFFYVWIQKRKNKNRKNHTFLNLDLFKNVRMKTVRIIHFLLHMLKKMIQNRSILYEFLRLQKKSHTPSYPTTCNFINILRTKYTIKIHNIMQCIYYWGFMNSITPPPMNLKIINYDISKYSINWNNYI